MFTGGGGSTPGRPKSALLPSIADLHTGNFAADIFRNPQGQAGEAVPKVAQKTNEKRAATRTGKEGQPLKP